MADPDDRQWPRRARAEPRLARLAVAGALVRAFSASARGAEHHHFSAKPHARHFAQEGIGCGGAGVMVGDGLNSRSPRLPPAQLAGTRVGWRRSGQLPWPTSPPLTFRQG